MRGCARGLAFQAMLHVRMRGSAAEEGGRALELLLPAAANLSMAASLAVS